MGAKKEEIKEKGVPCKELEFFVRKKFKKK
jgi:hypothetical protein